MTSRVPPFYVGHEYLLHWAVCSVSLFRRDSCRVAIIWRQVRALPRLGVLARGLRCEFFVSRTDRLAGPRGPFLCFFPRDARHA